MTAIERVIARARGEVGYIEKASNSQLDDKTANAGNKNWNKYAKYLDDLGVYNGKKNGFDWCDCFSDAMYIMEFGKDLGLKVICQPEKSYGAGVGWSAKYYKQQGRFDKNPAPGDQVYFIGSDGLYYHTGLVVAVDADTVTTIEGNAGTGSTRVVEKVYKRNDKKLGGFGHPRWDLVEDAPKAPETAKPAEPVKPPAETEKTEQSGAALKVGDVVKLTANALVYGTSYRFSNWVYSSDLFVRAIEGDRITVSTKASGAITGRVNIKHLTKNGAAVVNKPETFKVGDLVKMQKGAPVYGKSYGFSNWVYQRELFVRSVDGDKVTVSTGASGAVTGRVEAKYLTKIS